jgi:hypothetical protein
LFIITVLNQCVKMVNGIKMKATRERRAKKLMKRDWMHRTNMNKRDYLIWKRIENESVNNEEGD